jgi:UDP-2,3-diacylglucosamine pyrophosphatase LpxH
MRKLLQYLFRKPITWLANKFTSAPDKKAIFESLNMLVDYIHKGKTDYGLIIPFEIPEAKYIVFSDQHKGGKDAADDFRLAEKNYMDALKYYFENGFTLIAVGDCEELWENKPTVVIEKNRANILEEARFLQENRYFRTFGNHDLEWKFSLQRDLYLKPVFGEKLKVPEGIILKTMYNGSPFNILLTHGHQGDKQSDGNRFSMWFVASVWTPIQRFLDISVNTIVDSFELVDHHNIMMYEWSATQKNTIFISGHTHKPVFASMDHIERLLKQIEKAKTANDPGLLKELEAELNKRRKEYGEKKYIKTMVKPTYFNTGCCCFSDGDITGIEIEGDNIRLIKWKNNNGTAERMVLEHSPLSYIFEEMIG